MEFPTETNEDYEVQRFAVLIERVIDKKNKVAKQMLMKTQGSGIPMPEAAMILKGWANKVEEEIQKPFTNNLVFGMKEDGKDPDPEDA